MRIKFLLFLVLGTLAGYYTNAQCSVTSQPSHNCASYGDQIDAVKINGVSSPHSSGCSSGGHGGPHNTPGWLFIPGIGNSFTIQVGGGVYSEAIAIWVDYNNNGVYDASERVYASSGWSQNHNGSFTIPTGVPGGLTHMRVMCAYTSGTIPAGNACASYYGTWGEFEDYKVTICEPPSITNQPQNFFACENGTGQVSITASGADAYTWQINNGAGWNTITANSTFTNVNTNTLKLQNTPPTLNGSMFRCIVGACGNASKDTSQEVQMDVYANTEIEAQTFTDTSCIGLNTKFYVKSKGVITGYRWQIFDNDPKVMDYVDVKMPQFMSNNDTLIVVKSQDTLNGAKLRCIVSGLCGKDTSANIEMTVNALPAVTKHPDDITLDQGKKATFQITSAGIGVKYQWQVGVNNVFSNVNNGGIYTGVKTDRVQVKSVAHAQNEYQFRCIVKGSGSCAVDPDTSNIGVLYVNPPASVSTISTDEEVSMFPNPTSNGNVIIHIENTSAVSHYSIIDKMGRTLLRGDITKQNTTVDVNSLPTGIYNVQLTDKFNTIKHSLQLTKL